MSLRQAVTSASKPEVFAAIHAIYAQLATEISTRNPRCDASGRCCHFDAFDHRLYVTTAELATLEHDLKSHVAPSQPQPLLRVLDPGGCTFQIDKLCSIHALRPFGCRIFFCDPTATDWMTQTYERYHQKLRELHQLHALDYHYVEWRYALKQLAIV